MNVTSFENVSVLENARPRRGNPPWPDGFNTMAPSPQVTVYETVIELENVTSQENVTTLINETVRFRFLPSSIRRRRGAFDAGLGPSSKKQRHII